LGWSNEPAPWANYGANILAESCEKVAAECGAKSSSIIFPSIFRTNGVNVRVRILVDANVATARKRWSHFFERPRMKIVSLAVGAWSNRNRRERIAAKYMRRRIDSGGGLYRSKRPGTLRQNRRSVRGSRRGQMERRGLFRFQRLQFFLFAILPGNFAERRLLRFCVCVQRVLILLRWRGRAIIFLRTFILPGFDDCLIFRSQDALTLEIFFRVNVLGVFP
jgi:hypothetical protein